MNKIIPSFEKSLFDGSKDVICDLTELGIDSLLDEGLFKKIPVVGLLVGVKNTAQNLHDRNLLRQTLQFIKEFNNKIINEKNYKKYVKKLKSNPQKAEEELGRVLIILNNTIELQKSSMLANLFIGYINEEISWNEFCEYSEIIRNIFLNDVEVLGKIYIEKAGETKDYSVVSINRLKSLGLIDTSEKRNGFSIPMDTGYARLNENIALTNIGSIFYKLINHNKSLT